MIFVTVGEQLPFDRLISTVDDCALQIGEEIFAQIGKTDLKPTNIKYKKFLDPDLFKEKFMTATVIIAHAGMGTIITALDLGKSLIVMPRHASLGECRNDHQLATARKFLKFNYISVAFNEVELLEKLNNLDGLSDFSRKVRRSEPDPMLIRTIREFIYD